MVSDTGITAIGGYIPRLRLSRRAIADAHSWVIPGLKALAKGERAFCDHDEDAITMAVAAARSLGRPLSDDALFSILLASTSLPFLDRQNSSIVGEALGLADGFHTADVVGSQRAATSALIQALQAPRDQALVLAAEKRRCKPGSVLEISSADAAAAVLVGTDNLIARHLGAYTVSRDFVDHYRSTSTEFDYSLEERWIRDEGLLKIIPQAVAGLLQQTRVGSEQINRLLIPVTTMRTAQAIAKKCGIDPAAVADNLQEKCGNAGCAQPLLMLANTLESAQAGEKILVVGFGQGCDALLFEVTENVSQLQAKPILSAALEGGTTDTNYMRYLSFNGLIEIDWGIRVERDKRTAHSAFYRRRESLTSFVGGRCSQCQTVQFPKTKICVNPACQQVDTQTNEPLRDKRGHVKSFTEDWLGHSSSPPFMYGRVSFADKAALMMEFASFLPGELAIGTPVQMAFRIKDVDEMRGYHRYFWKAVPATDDV
jgi:3-hydroxy-3-methylglutaryl CoA synthase